MDATKIATLGPATILAGMAALAASRGDTTAARVATTARAAWIVDQQHKHAALAGVTLAANEVCS